MAIHFEITPPQEPKKSFHLSLDMDKILIGRGSSCDVILPSPIVSYHHATIEAHGPFFTIIDNKSKNGTYLGDIKLTPGKRYQLKNHDCIRICGFEIKVELSVVMDEPFSAEKSSNLAREILLYQNSSINSENETGSQESSDSKDRNAINHQHKWSVSIEIISGNRTTEFYVPVTKKTFSMGTTPDCDYVISEKKISNVKLEMNMTPLGWKIVKKLLPSNPLHISLPPSERLKDGTAIVIGKTKIVFHDPIDRELTRLLTAKSLEENIRTSPQNFATHEVNHKEHKEENDAKKKSETQNLKNDSHTVVGNNFEYISEFRIIATLIGIVAFLISLGILIFILW